MQQRPAAVHSSPNRWQAPILATQTVGGQQQRRTATGASENNNMTPAPAMLQHHKQWHPSPETTIERVANAAIGNRPPMVHGHGQRPIFPTPMPSGVVPKTATPSPQHQQPQKQQQQQSGGWFWS